MTDLDSLWSNLLSGEPDRMRRQWLELTPEERLAIIAHLRQMTSEEGWSAPQRQSARAALDVLTVLDVPSRGTGTA